MSYYVNAQSCTFTHILTYVAIRYSLVLACSYNAMSRIGARLRSTTYLTSLPQLPSADTADATILQQPWRLIVTPALMIAPCRTVYYLWNFAIRCAFVRSAKQQATSQPCVRPSARLSVCPLDSALPSVSLSER